MAVTAVTISWAVISIIFGILVLAFPRFLRYFVGFYFIITGLLQLFAPYF